MEHIMSETPEQITASVIDRSNRLLSLRSNPGFRDAWQISQNMVDIATAIAVDYGGWDSQQITVLKVRAQAAKEHHELFFAKIVEAIRDGIEAQATAANLTDKTPAEVVEQGDYVRQQVLTRFEEFDAEGRLPGTY
jgi:hypothetical protein